LGDSGEFNPGNWIPHYRLCHSVIIKCIGSQPYKWLK